jgi:Bacterial regulatory helix-turn-helix protein, lysR family
MHKIGRTKTAKGRRPPLLLNTEPPGGDIRAVMKKSMTPEQVRIYIAIGERQHMTRAAEALTLTQQAVSAAIVTLENSYSTARFHGVGRRLCRVSVFQIT